MNRYGRLVMLILPVCGACLQCTPGQPEFVSLDSFRLVDVSDDSLLFQVAVTIESTDSRRAVLESAAYDIVIDGAVRGSGSWQGSVEFLPGRPAPLVLPVRIGAGDVPFWIDALLNADTLEMDIPLRFSASTDLGSWPFTMDFSTEVPLDGVLERWALQTAFQLSPMLEGVSSPSVGLGGAVLPAVISLQNPYPFDLELQSLEIELAISGASLGMLGTSEPVLLPARCRGTLELEAHVSSLGPLLSSAATLIQRELSYSLSGDARLSLGGVQIVVPISAAGEIPVPGLR